MHPLTRVIELQNKSKKAHPKIQERLAKQIEKEAREFLERQRQGGDPLGLIEALRDGTPLRPILSLGQRIRLKQETRDDEP